MEPVRTKAEVIARLQQQQEQLRALGGMMQSTSCPADQLGGLVRKASKHKGPWPKVSVWHGNADRTVNPGNANEIVKQWLDVHGLPSAPMSTGDVDGHPDPTAREAR